MARECTCTDASRLDVVEIAQALRTDCETGLSAADVAQRLARGGPNALRSVPPTPAWKRLLAQFHDPLIYLLLSAIVVTLVVWEIEGQAGWPFDAIAIAVIVVLNAILGFVQEARAETAAAALAKLSEVTVSVIREGQLQRIPSTGLVCGDLLALAEGDAVGADARLVRAVTLFVQEASLTGESEPVLKDAATLASAVAVADQRNMVFKGTAVVRGNGLALVTATGMDTQMGAIAALLERTEEDPTPLQREVSRIGRMLGTAVLIIALIVVASVLLESEIRSARDLLDVLLLGVSLAVAAVPEGLPAVLSIVLAIGVQRMAARNAIVKRLSSVETLGSASVICSDKTGTLTRSEMTIVRVATLSGTTEVSGVGYAPEGEIHQAGKALSHGPAHAEHVVVLSGGSLAGNAELSQTADGTWQIQGDPTEAAFLVAERKLGVHERRYCRFERVAEMPFTSERKMMSVVAIDREHDDAPVVIAKGAPDVLLGRCMQARVGLEVVALDDETRSRLLADVDEMSDAALRTLAVAYRPLAAGEEVQAGEALEHDLIFAGTVGIIDPPREEAKQAISDALRAGIRVIMITGDHPRTAARIAADLGIVQPGATAITGAEIDAMDDAAFADAVRTTSVFARVAPAHKLRIVDALQADGDVVAMTGDGVNDAPALKSADIGVAMGGTGTEVTKEAAKMILADDNFATIVAAVREGRGIFDNIEKFLRYLLSSNMGEVLTIFLGVLGAGVIGLQDGSATLVLPLLATQILWINLLTDSWPAMAMGVDPHTDEVMARPPRRPDERVIDARMWVGVVQMGLVMAIAALLTIDLFLPGGLIQGTHEIETARTAGFTVLVFAQLFNCFNARSALTSAFHRPFANPWLWAAVTLSALLQVAVVHVELFNRAFGTVPLSGEQWLLCLAMASTVLWFGELRKLILHIGRPRVSASVSASFSSHERHQ
jgi:Ca2+-transporting ATPase